MINFTEKQDQFYPTPKPLIDKMLQDIKWVQIENILEPSAGKGDIVLECLKHDRYGHLFVDAIEKNSLFHQVIQNNVEKYYNSDSIYRNKKAVPIVHDDFLTYEPLKKYDLIVMNPPFNNGDRHLLKALEIQKNGGSIICILNAETLKNPYSKTRQELVQQLQDYNASIEYLQEEFATAERKTNVEIALIKVTIPMKEQPSFYYEKFKTAEQYNEPDIDNTELEITDFVKMIVNRYKIEVKSYTAFFQEYRALKKVSLNANLPFSLNPRRGSSTGEITLNEMLKAVRLNYWQTLLESPKIIGKLPSDVAKEYRTKVSKMQDYDITEYNIKNLMSEINALTKSSLEEQIIKTFDELTHEHSMWDGNCKNIHYYSGWKTNKAHRIDKKVVIPCYHVYNEWTNAPDVQNIINKIEDIEKVFNFLDGNMTQEVDLRDTVKNAVENGETKNIQVKYFKMNIYKKGTIHLTFTCPELIERLNIYVGKSRNWLPPSYGTKAYKDMNKAEQEVIDSFQGKAEYEKILQKKDFYIASPVRTQLLLNGGDF